jgi:hypothetical protein
MGGAIDKGRRFDHKPAGRVHIPERPFYLAAPEGRPVSKAQKIKRLAGREYLPMVATIAMWAVIVAAIGHADAARLLAAVTMMRAAQMLTKLATPLVLKRRLSAPKEIRRQAKRFALSLQAAAFVITVTLVALLAMAMDMIGQDKIAAMLPFVAIGMPARYLRFADVRTASPYYRLALASSGLVLVSLGWAAGWQAAALGLAFGAREWAAFAVLRWWPRETKVPKTPIDEPLHFPEVARTTAVVGRKMLTYRLSKSLLAPFGPIGNIAARTGRGLKLHQKLEPYIPHHFWGFLLFSLVTFGGAIFLALRSGEPAAMIGAAGLAQISAAAANVLLLWRYLPSRDSEVIEDDDDDDE